MHAIAPKATFSRLGCQKSPQPVVEAESVVSHAIPRLDQTPKTPGLNRERPAEAGAHDA